MVEKFDGKLMGIKSGEMYDLLKLLRNDPSIANCYTAGEYHHLLAGSNFDASQLLDYLRIHGHADAELKDIVPDIEDVFIKLLSNEN